MRLMFLIMSLLLSTLALGQANKVELNETNSVVLREDFNSLSIGKLLGDLAALDSAEPSDEPIYLVLITPGGYIVDGMTLYTVTAGMNRPVHTITIFAASMGFQTVQNMGKRYITPYGILMSHKASGGFKGEFGGKGKSQVDSRYGLWLSIINQLDAKTVERTNGKKTLDQYQSEYENELWLLGKQAVDNGYADELVLAACSSELSKQSEKVEIGIEFLKVQAEISKCPLDTTIRSVKLLIPTSEGYLTLDDYIEKGGVVTSICGLTASPTGKDKEGDKVLCIQHPNIMGMLHEVSSKVNNGKLNLVDLHMKNIRPLMLYPEDTEASLLIYRK
jgi:ATP-dependent protease ClpP protease subunit